jgi:hypothetical protein
MSSACVPHSLRRGCRSSSAPASSRLRSSISGIPLQHGGMATGVWTSLAGKDDDMDEHELAPIGPVATQSSPLAAQSMGREAKASSGWQEVLPRRSLHRPKSPASAPPPRPIPAWLSGRCCRCLAHGHRAVVCKDPFRCSRCLENRHRKRECRNPWRPLSSLACLAAPPVSYHVADHHHTSTSCVGSMRSAPPSKEFRCGS